MEQEEQNRVFKGMRRYRYRNDEASVEDAKRSPYYWWWAYLRLSKDYWLICTRKGVAEDARLKSMYRDFGDVFANTFEEWWRRRGAGLFSERLALPKVREVQREQMALSRDTESTVLLEVPLNMTERTLIRQIREILRQHPQRQIERVSTAIRPLAQLKGIRQDVLQVAYEVWQRHYESERANEGGGAVGRKGLYQIGKEMRLVRTCMPAVTDSDDKARKKVNGMKVAVSRMLSRANNLIDNAALGSFPCVTTIKMPVLWRDSAKRALAYAEREGLWRPLFNENETLSTERFTVDKER